MPAWVRFPLPSAFPVFWVFPIFCVFLVPLLLGWGMEAAGGPGEPMVSRRSGVFFGGFGSGLLLSHDYGPLTHPAILHLTTRRKGCGMKLDSLRGSSVKIGTIQRRLAWPLRKDDTHKSRSVFVS